MSKGPDSDYDKRIISHGHLWNGYSVTSNDGDRKPFDVMTSTELLGTIGSVASLLVAPSTK